MAFKLYKKILFAIIIFSLPARVLAQTEYMVIVDPSNAHITKIDSIPGIKWLQTTAAYNENNEHYTFIGLTDPPATSPKNFITVFAPTAGQIFGFAPLLDSANKFVHYRYSKTTGILWGVMVDSIASYHVAIIDPYYGTNSAFTGRLPNAVGIMHMTIDEDNHRLFLFGSGVNNTNQLQEAIWTIDTDNGNITFDTLTQRIAGPTYDHVTHKIYGFTRRDAPQPGRSIWSSASLDPDTKLITVIADVPDLGTFGVPYNETLNENDHIYYVRAIDTAHVTGSGTVNFLFSIDLFTGNSTKVVIPTGTHPGDDNLCFFRYNNITSTLYAMYWEAHTILLPLTLNKLDAIQQQRNVLCKWQTLQETNTNHFDIERSEDGLNFTSIGKLTAKGNSNIKTDYSFPDNDPFSTGKTYLYYRLKMVDNDTRFAYSNTVKVKLDYASSLNIFPNPASDHLSVDLFAPANDKAIILITDHVGRKVYSQDVAIKKGSNRFQINTSLLAAGVYNLSVTGSNNYFSSFIKN
ncbi:MAG: T9SS type A sorting domain-containing protein [Ferruginibacter sp.]